MRLSLKTKQVAGVTMIVVVVVVVLSALHMATLARVSLEQSMSRGELLARAIFQRAREVVAATDDPLTAMRDDDGIRSILESSIGYTRNVTYAVVTDRSGVAVAHSFPSLEGQPFEAQTELAEVVRQGALAQLGAIWADRTLEVRQPLLLGEEEFGSIRIGVSTLLVRSDLQEALTPAAATALLVLIVTTLAATGLAQWLLTPIHVIKSGLSRLDQGEFGVTLDLPPGEEFQDLGTSFNSISAQLSAGRNRLGDPTRGIAALAQHLEDAVAVFSAQAQLLFANEAMRSALPCTELPRPLEDCAPADHPYRRMVEQVLATHQSCGPVSAALPDRDDETEPVERLVAAHAIEGADGSLVGVMLVARNLEYLTRVQSTVNYSRKLASLGRLLAGVAHEVKNPLNAMTIHLELVRQKLAGLQPPAPDESAGERALADPARLAGDEAGRPAVEVGDVLKHVRVITGEIHRLDDAIQGLLKFTRHEELNLQPVPMTELIDGVLQVVHPQARAAGVTVEVHCPANLPPINADAAMLRQALLNLALNACQAMPNGGLLRIACWATGDRWIELDVEDNGAGIAPAHLEHIFDLYFTTKPDGSGIGLSLVYRTIQLHDGEIEVHSVVGRGTRFHITLPAVVAGMAPGPSPTAVAQAAPSGDGTDA